VTPSSALQVIACGAIAHEIMAVLRAGGWQHLTVQCLPPELHNRPERIPGAVRAAIRAAHAQGSRVFVAYADCGTGGRLDAVLQEEGAERIPGAHCYEFFAGPGVFAELSEAEPGTFYLTDFLARHFDRLVWRGLGLDRHPELRALYFGNYRRVLYLSQAQPPPALEAARDAAQRLGLEFEHRVTGYGDLASALTRAAEA
jgi:hypothetical protein